LSELYEYVQGVFLIRVIGAIIMAPRKPRFVVTAKNVGHDSNQLSPMAFPYFVIYCLLFAAALVSGYKYYFTPGATNLMVVVGLWNFFNLLTAGAALGVVAERGKTEDMALPLEVERYGALRINGLAIDVRIESVSSEKCRIRMEALPPMRWEDDADKGMLSVLPIQGVGKGTASLSALPVRMTRIGHLEEEWICELTFERLSPRDYFALVDLMYADPDVMTRFVQRRRARKDLFSGCAQFIWWGLSEPFRAFSYLFAGAWSRPPAGKQRDPQAAQLTRLAPLHPNQFGSARDMTADTIARSPRPAWQADRRQNGDIPAAAAGTTPSWVELMTEAENDAVAQEHRKSSNGEARPDGGET